MNVYKVLDSGVRVPVTQAGFRDERQAVTFARMCADSYARDWRASVTLGRPRQYVGVVAVEVRSSTHHAPAYRTNLHPLAFPELHVDDPAASGGQAPEPAPVHAGTRPAASEPASRWRMVARLR